MAAADGTVRGGGGTLTWAAPELYSQLAGEMGPHLPVTTKADLASFGYTLAWCWGLCYDVGGLHAFAREGASLPAGMDPSLRDLIYKLTACDPRQRISAAAALRHPFLQPVGCHDDGAW
jgi:hypothetical protein